MSKPDPLANIDRYDQVTASDPWKAFRSKQAGANHSAGDFGGLSGLSHAEQALQPSADASGGPRTQSASTPVNDEVSAWNSFQAKTNSQGMAGDVPTLSVQFPTTDEQLFKLDLPEGVIDRFRYLIDKKDDAYGAARTVRQDEPNVRENLMIANQRVQKRKAEIRHGYRGDVDEEAGVVELQKKADHYKKELDRISARAEPHYDRAAEFARVLDPCRSYLKKYGQRLRKAAKPSIDKKLNLSASLAIVDDLKNKLEDVREAPLPASIAKQRVSEEIERLAAAGKPSLYRALQHDSEHLVGWPSKGVAIQERADGLAKVGGALKAAGLMAITDDHSVAILAWLNKDTLISALHAEIDALADESKALDPATRAYEEREAEIKLLEAERVAAEIAWQSEQVHLLPPSIDPRAVLGVEGPEPEDRGLY